MIIQGAAAPKKLVGKMSAVTVVASNAARPAAPLKRKGVQDNPTWKGGLRISEDSVAYIENELLLHATWDEIVYCTVSTVVVSTPWRGGEGAMTLPLHWAGRAVPTGGGKTPTR